jgi:sarcosine oxidase
MKHRDAIVLGCGGLGSAALYWLARAGADALGIEQFPHGHELGASHDHSRIIRLSYDAPEYARLAPAAYACWSEIEQESGVQLVFRTGGLDLGPVEPGVPSEVEGLARTMRSLGISFEEWTPAETMRHFPPFRLPENVRVLYQAETGLVDARRATQVHALLARARGATLQTGTRVNAIHPRADGIEVVTDRETHTCSRLVVTAGAWLGPLLRGLGHPLEVTVTREQVTYFCTPHLRDFAIGRFPVWLWYGNRDHCFYGFPVYGEAAVKVAEDVGGQPTTPEARGFEKDLRSDRSLRNFLGRFLPSALGPELYTRTCLYDMVRDRNFILDALPGRPDILVAHGAAHSFKFASLIGRILADLALDGHTAFDIGAFRFDRPALADPSQPPAFKIHDRSLEWSAAHPSAVPLRRDGTAVEA